MRTIPIYTKKAAAGICGSLTETSKMPCKSYGLPTRACVTGARMAAVPGSICSDCYANKGAYKLYARNVLPAQEKRLASLDSPEWVPAMVALIGADKHFRWHDSGDVQSVEHLRKIALVCERTPECAHWLPTREYAMVREYLDTYGALPGNLIIRLSAMFPDVPVKVPESLRDVPGVRASNVHAVAPAQGFECRAPSQNGECRDCRACWNRAVPVVSYHQH